MVIKLAKEEIIFAKQLFSIRKQIHKLQIEETTNTDRLLSIMRGRMSKAAQGGGFLITRAVVDHREVVIITENGEYPV